MEKVLVIGAARSGTAAAKLLKRQGFDVVLTDAKPVASKEELEGLEIQVEDGGHPDWLFETDWDFVVKNPGIPYTAPIVDFFVKKGTPVYTEIETAYRAAPQYQYGAITGTDGKTTVTTMLYEMLKAYNPKARYAGNIGVPLSEVVLEEGDVSLPVALELSNFQLLGIDSFRPRVSTVTNLAPDHLDYMDSLEHYYASKMRIYENCAPEDIFIRNIDDPEIVKYATGIPCRVVDFSLQGPADLWVDREKDTVFYGDVALFAPSSLKVVGDFNLGNAMMAAAMAYELGVDVDTIRKVLASFKGVEHRIEYVDEIGGVRIYNDSKATNAHAACAGLSAFKDNLILLCGGKDKHISFADMAAYDKAVKQCISFGQTADKFADVFTRQTSVETMEEALDLALSMAVPGDTILLSPACSSFDQFKNYEERGRIFKDLVAKRKEREA